MFNQYQPSPLYLLLSSSTNSCIIITLWIGERQIKLSSISEGEKNLSSEKSIGLVARNPDYLFLRLTLAGLGKINLSISLDLSDFLGKIKVFDRILSERDFPDFNVLMVECLLYMQR